MNDAKRGGDIDLLIFSEQPEFELSQKISRDFFKQCEEKIDVLVINPKRMTKEQSLAHEYPDDPEMRTNAINRFLVGASQMSALYQRVLEYIDAHFPHFKNQDKI